MSIPRSIELRYLIVPERLPDKLNAVISALLYSLSFVDLFYVKQSTFLQKSSIRSAKSIGYNGGIKLWYVFSRAQMFRRFL